MCVQAACPVFCISRWLHEFIIPDTNMSWYNNSGPHQNPPNAMPHSHFQSSQPLLPPTTQVNEYITITACLHLHSLAFCAVVFKINRLKYIIWPSRVDWPKDYYPPFTRAIMLFPHSRALSHIHSIRTFSSSSSQRRLTPTRTIRVSSSGHISNLRIIRGRRGIFQDSRRNNNSRPLPGILVMVPRSSSQQT